MISSQWWYELLLLLFSYFFPPLYPYAQIFPSGSCLLVDSITTPTLVTSLAQGPPTALPRNPVKILVLTSQWHRTSLVILLKVVVCRWLPLLVASKTQYPLQSLSSKNLNYGLVVRKALTSRFSIRPTRQLCHQPGVLQPNVMCVFTVSRVALTLEFAHTVALSTN